MPKYLVVAMLDDLASQPGQIIGDPIEVVTPVTSLFEAVNLLTKQVHGDLKRQLEEVRGPRSAVRSIAKDAPRVYGDLYYADVWYYFNNMDRRKAYTPQTIADDLQVDLSEPEAKAALANMIKLSCLPLYVHDEFEALFYENKGPLTVADIHPLWEIWNLSNGRDSTFSREFDLFLERKEVTCTNSPT